MGNAKAVLVGWCKW